MWNSYKKNSRAKSMAAASPGMFRAVNKMRTVTKLAPVTEGMARADTHVNKLKKMNNTTDNEK